MPQDHRLDTTTTLTPGNAVAAIIVIGGKYLLQLRDDIAGIFFPAHWGCFGGGIEPHETREDALVRELHEELDLRVAPSALRYFTRFEFDFSFMGMGSLSRDFYEIELGAGDLPRMRVQEGAAMRLFDPKDLLAGPEPLAPYDGFALWLHINRERLKSSPP